MLFKETRLKFYAKRDKGMGELGKYEMNHRGHVENLLAQIEDEELKKNAPLYFALPFCSISWICAMIWTVVTSFEFWKWFIIAGILWFLTYCFGPDILKILK